ncbi:MAG: hypothetical protein ABUT20_60790, partial [Bacteroidota bacterium]
MKFSVPFILILVLLFQELLAQSNYQYTTYTQENGLASGTIRGIKKDKTGFIWLMSENGLTRFDGYTFKKFQHNPSDSNSISSIDVRNMVMDKEGDVLFQTANGLCKYIPAVSGFRKVLLFRNSDEYCGALGSSDGFWIIKRGSLLFLDAQNKLSPEYKFPKKFRARAMHFVTES